MSACSHLAELASALHWQAAERIALAWTHYDESGEYDAAGNLINMSVAGCVSTLSRWTGFDQCWNAALVAEGLPSGTCFHMTDFEAWQRPFDFLLPDGSHDEGRHKRLLRSLLNLMLEHAEEFVGFAMGLPIAPDRKRQHRLAMENCVISDVTHAVHDTWERYQEPTNLVFAKQDHFSYAKIMKVVELYDYGEGRGRIGSVVVDTPQRIPELQAADILAYELAKAQRANRCERFPFRHLVEGARARGIPMTLSWKVTPLMGVPSAKTPKRRG